MLKFLPVFSKESGKYFKGNCTFEKIKILSKVINKVTLVGIVWVPLQSNKECILQAYNILLIFPYMTYTF